MSKRKHSLVDLTASPPLPLPLTSRALAPRADSTVSSRSSSRSSRSSRGGSKRHRRVNVDSDTSQPTAGSSQQAINVDATDEDVVSEAHAPVAGPSNPRPAKRTPSPPPSHMLAAHTCPICFSGVTNACLTPCGHVLCGACLFAAVKSGIQRALTMGIPAGGDGTAAKCPVCRALLKGWDGKGGGIIPLKIRTIVAL